MALTRRKLIDIQTIPLASTALYANPNSTTISYVRSLVLHNLGSGAVVIRVYNVPDNSGALGTAALANRFLSISLPSSDTAIIDFAQPIVLDDANDAIFAECSVANGATIQILGDKDVL